MPNDHEKRARWGVRFGRALPLIAIAAVVLLANPAGAASAKPAKAEILERSNPRDRKMIAGDVHRYHVKLQSSQVLLATVDQRGIDLVVSTFDPTGKKIADIDSARGNAGSEAVVVEARQGGTFTIEVRPRVAGTNDLPLATEPDASYEIRIDETLSIDAYAERQVRETIDSPRLLELWRAVRAKQRGALETFWSELHGKAPIVEPYSADGATLLVTWVLRSSAPFVALVGGPRSFRENPMNRLAGTDLWYLSAPMPRDARGYYWFVVADQPVGFHVPFKPLSLPERKNVVDPNNPTSSVDDSRFELPGTPARVWSLQTPRNPAGKLVSLELDSVALKEKRQIGIYTPPDYDPSRRYPLVIAFDGEAYGLIPEYNDLGIPLPWILDNLIAAKRIPPVVAVLVAEQGKRMRDLAMSPAFASFITSEVIPKLRSEYKAGLTPASTVVTGSSLGGLCATFIAMGHPDLVGGVLSQSGAFGYRPGLFEREMSDADEEGSVIRSLVKSPKLPLRFYLDVGLFENDSTPPWTDVVSILSVNRRMRDVLEAKGYAVSYAEFSGGHDYLVWRETIADGLTFLLSP